ncbi:MAG: hypothetical protein QXK94_02245 [Candidatus Jordarchaeales archaeon]
MILITTSRRPTRRVRSFCKDLERVIPGAVKVNRGKKNIYEVLAEAAQRNLPYAVVVETWKGNPGNMLFYRADIAGAREPLAIFRIKGVKLQREFGKKRIEKVSEIKVLRNERCPELTDFLSKVLGSSETGEEQEKKVILEVDTKNGENVMIFRIDGEEVGPRIRFRVLRMGGI